MQKADCSVFPEVCFPGGSITGAPLRLPNYFRLSIIILANLRLENKDFLLPASDCVSTDANDSQLMLTLEHISSLTCLVFSPQRLTKLKQLCFSLPCCDSTVSPVVSLFRAPNVQEWGLDHISDASPTSVTCMCPVQPRIQLKALPGLVSACFYPSRKIVGAAFCDICLLLPGTLE